MTYEPLQQSHGHAAHGGEDNYALEVVIAWDRHAILHVAHLSPPRSFYLGESGSTDEPASDFVVDTRALGVARLPLILKDAAAASVLIPAGAELEVELAGELLTTSELDQRGLLAPAAEVAGAHLFALTPDARVRVAYLGLSCYVRYTEQVAAPRAAAVPGAFIKQHRWQLASFGLHGLLLGSFYFLPPRASALSLELLKEDNRFVQYQLTPPAADNRPDWLKSAAIGGSEGQAAEGDQGAMGDPDRAAPPTKQRVSGKRAEAAAHTLDLVPRPLDREQGILGVLRRMNAGQSALFVRERAEGSDRSDDIGSLFAERMGLGGGAGGLAMLGTGRGGGGTGDGTVGSGDLGTLGVGSGRGGYGPGFGPGAGGGLRGHTARVPTIRTTPPEVHGSLSKETIRRVIGRHLSEVRHCYEQRLVSRPELQGRVAVRFMINATGAVQVATVASSDLGDPQVGACITGAVQRWIFPAPEGGGAVLVNYPFLLSQTAN